MPSVICSNLTVGYGRNPVASNISFEIGAGDRLAVTGENGSGKSTFLKTVTGLIPKISGDFKIDGRLAYVPQVESENEDFPVTALEVAMSGMSLKEYGYLYAFFSKDAYKKVHLKLEELGADNLAKERFSHLSGGQKQKILITRALLSVPSEENCVLFLDEPTKGLDEISCRELYKIQNDFASKGGCVVVVTHDMNEITSNNFNYRLNVKKNGAFFTEVN